MRKLLITAIMLLAMCSSSYAGQLCVSAGPIIFAFDKDNVEIAIEITKMHNVKTLQEMFISETILPLKKGVAARIVDAKEGVAKAMIPNEPLPIYVSWPKGWVCK